MIFSLIGLSVISLCLINIWSFRTNNGDDDSYRSIMRLPDMESMEKRLRNARQEGEDHHLRVRLPEGNVMMGTAATAIQNSTSSWPSLELVPAHSEDERIILDWLLPSLQLFWFSAKLVVLAENNSEGHMWAESFLKAVQRLGMGPNVRIEFMDSPCQDGTLKCLKNRAYQQYYQMVSDGVTTAEYVGFVDTDTLLLNPILPEHLFDSMARPHVIGFVGCPYATGPHYRMWGDVPAATQAGMKMPYVARGMANFPFIMRRTHLADMRQWLLMQNGIANSTLNDFKAWFVENARSEHFEQFGYMIAYMFYQQRAAYAWHFQEVNQQHDVKGQIKVAELQRMTLPEEWAVWPRVMVHASYHPGLGDKSMALQPGVTGDDVWDKTYRSKGPASDSAWMRRIRVKRAQLLLQGMCLSKILAPKGLWCDQVLGGPFMDDLFMFDGLPTWGTDKSLGGAVQAQEELHRRIANARPYWLPLKLLMELVAEPLGLGFETLKMDWHIV